MGRCTKPRLVEENLGYIWEEGKGQSWQGDDASIKRAAESAFKSFLFLRQAARRSLGSRVSNCPACHRASRHHRAVYTLRRGNTRDPRCLRKMGAHGSSAIAAVEKTKLSSPLAFNLLLAQDEFALQNRYALTLWINLFIWIIFYYYYLSLESESS